MILRRALVALGLLAPACSSPAPTRRSAPTTAVPAPSPGTADSRPGDVPPTTSSAPATSTTEAEAPTTTTVVTMTVPTTPRRTTTTFVLPERADEDMSDVEWAVRQAFPETPDKAVRVARCESGLNPAATNGQHVGIMQIATTVHAKRIADMGYTVADLYGVTANLAVARAIYDDAGGWSPWTCAA